MLIEFRVKNFRSIRDEQILNLTASSSHNMEEGHVFVAGASGFRMLTSVAIYGANASGKSNLLQAMGMIRHLVLNSAEGQAGDAIEVEPFKLDQDFSDAPSTFEMHFIHEDVRYQYGFSVNRERVYEEWLLAYPHGMPQRWFERTWNDAAGQMEWKYGPNFRGERAKLAGMTRENALFLSLGAKFNHPQLTPVFKWFREYLRGLTHVSGGGLVAYTADRCEEDTEFRNRVETLLKVADVGIDGLRVNSRLFSEAELPSGMPDEIRKSILKDMKDKKIFEVQTQHHVADGVVAFDLDDESDGTQRLFALAGPWLDVLENGYSLFVDEMDASMHPLLARKLVELFHDPGINTKGAQLVFTTHDTTLLDASLLRSDQIMFTEKDEHGATRLYSLLEYRPRKSEALQKGYLAGRYGALPYLGEFSF